jgi:hypothetical protein
VLVGTIFALWGIGRGIAHWAHLGGYAAAYLYLRWIEVRSDRAQFKKRLDDATFGKQAPVPGTAPPPDFDSIKRDGLHSLTLEELDRLRAKVAAEGLSALTPDERAFLHRMTLR